MPGINTSWAELDCELLRSVPIVAGDIPRDGIKSTRVGESGVGKFEFEELGSMSMTVGWSSPAGTKGSPEVPLLKAIFSLEVGLPFSSGLGGILGTIQCASGCRSFDKSRPEIAS